MICELLEKEARPHRCPPRSCCLAEAQEYLRGGALRRRRATLPNRRRNAGGIAVLGWSPPVKRAPCSMCTTNRIKVSSLRAQRSNLSTSSLRAQRSNLIISLRRDRVSQIAASGLRPPRNDGKTTSSLRRDRMSQIAASGWRPPRNDGGRLPRRTCVVLAMTGGDCRVGLTSSFPYSLRK